MNAFALYRLPHTDQIVRVEQTSGTPEELSSCQALNGRQGFVIAPFQITPDQPILLIRPDRVDIISSECMHRPSSASHDGLSNASSPTPDYAADFVNFHAQLEADMFRKIVLARCAEEHPGSLIAPSADVCLAPSLDSIARSAEERPDTLIAPSADECLTPSLDPITLFERACHRYPRLFIALVYTPRTGYWLTATPEILLEGGGTDWRTIALAGTMRLEGDQLSGEGESVTWSTKNIQEQRYVATYIAECLERFASSIQEEGPRTVRAANLVHLRSDFTFTLPDADHLGDLLDSLHPTPAVCGLPKQAAFDFIVAHEHTPRRYYSGFMGPLNLSLPASSSLCLVNGGGAAVPSAGPSAPSSAPSAVPSVGLSVPSSAPSALPSVGPSAPSSAPSAGPNSAPSSTSSIAPISPSSLVPSSLPFSHLYVSLRCMHIAPDCCHLYAGGGLLKDSVLEQEWQETEAKLDTMRSLFKVKSEK